MRICFVITKSEVGGAQKWVKDQIDILKEHGYECFICTSQEGWLTTNSQATATFTDERIEQRMSFGFLRKLNQFIRNNDIDLLVGNSANGGIYARLSGLLTSTACIYVSHGWSSVYNGGNLAFVYNWIEKLLAGISSKVLCVSGNDYQIANQTIGIAEDKLEVIVNKIFPIQIVAESKVSKENTRTTKLLFLGRLASPKLPLSLIKAVGNEHSIQLDLVGTGPNMDSIKKFICEEEIQNVNVRGEIKNFDEFNKYDLFCLISESEGLPLSAVEALSCGLPILISNVGGCPEVIEDNGYLTDNSPEDILKGIQLIQKNRERFSKNSRKLFAEKFDLSTNYGEYLNLYEKVLG
jgi:glycosyltransferase involved in cell wall biosynthesis